MTYVPKLGMQPTHNPPLPIFPNTYMLGSFQQIKIICKLAKGALNRGILLAFLITIILTVWVETTALFIENHTNDLYLPQKFPHIHYPKREVIS